MITFINRKTLLATVTSLCIGLTVSNAEAVATRGVPSCGTWVKETNEDQWQIVATRGWLVGFLTGLAVASDKDVLRGTDNASWYLWVNNYCQANPLKKLDSAGYILFLELSKQKGL